MDIAQDVARWVADFSAPDAPPGVLRHADRSLMDVIGVSLAGSDHDACRQMRALAAGQYGPGECTVIGAAQTGSALAAAMVNGTAAHVLDLDDVSYDGMVHASAVVWPAVWAAGEAAAASGRKTREAFIAAVEVHCALGRAFTHAMFWRGFWTTGLLGSVAAAAGAAKVMSLDADATRRALEIALAQASGLRAIVGTPMKALACGLAAENGVRAALMAQSGVGGAPGVAAHPLGFAALHNAGVIDTAAIDSLGTRFVLSEAPMAFKQYPICAYGQSAVEALGDARSALGADPVAVLCEVPVTSIENMPYGIPATTTQAQFSLPFALAAMLAYSTLAPKHLTAAILADPKLHAALQRVTVRAASGGAAQALAGCGEGAVVTASAADGRSVTRTVRVPTGMPERPLSDEQLRAKFHACVDPLLGTAAATALAARIAALDESTNIRSLAGPLLRGALAASCAVLPHGSAAARR